MANRTFKVYGQAYAASGDVSVVMSVGGTEVFNGAVNDSTTVRNGQPTVENHLWTYELDENTTGNLAVSIAVTGGELCIGPIKNNLCKTQIIPDSWFDTNDTSTTESQTYMANQIGQTLLDAEQAGLHAKLVAGTATEEDSLFILAANANGPRSADVFDPVNDARSSAQINGELLADWDDVTVNAKNWPILQDGDTFTCTWAFDPDTPAVTE